MGRGRNGIIHYICKTLGARQLWACQSSINTKHCTLQQSRKDTVAVFIFILQVIIVDDHYYDIKHVLNAYKYSLDASRSKFQTRLKAIGIDMGDNIFIDALGQVHGVAMTNARAYAEAKFSTSQEGSIFLSLNIVNNISSIPTFHMANFARGMT